MIRVRAQRNMLSSLLKDLIEVEFILMVDYHHGSNTPSCCSELLLTRVPVFQDSRMSKTIFRYINGQDTSDSPNRIAQAVLLKVDHDISFLQLIRGFLPFRWLRYEVN